MGAYGGGVSVGASSSGIPFVTPPSTFSGGFITIAKLVDPLGNYVNSPAYSQTTSKSSVATGVTISNNKALCAVGSAASSAPVYACGGGFYQDLGTGASINTACLYINPGTPFASMLTISNNLAQTGNGGASATITSNAQGGGVYLTGSTGATDGNVCGNPESTTAALPNFGAVNGNAAIAGSNHANAQGGGICWSYSPATPLPSLALGDAITSYPDNANLGTITNNFAACGDSNSAAQGGGLCLLNVGAVSAAGWWTVSPSPLSAITLASGALSGNMVLGGTTGATVEGGGAYLDSTSTTNTALGINGGASVPYTITVYGNADSTITNRNRVFGSYHFSADGPSADPQAGEELTNKGAAIFESPATSTDTDVTTGTF
jgi:hypothetical protein